MAVGHFYLINDTDTVRHISQSFKENNIVCSSIIADEMNKVEYKYFNFYEVFNEMYNADLDVEEDEEGNFINQERDYNKEFDIIEKLEKDTIILYTQGNLNNELKAYLNKYNEAPKIKYSSLSNVKEIKTHNGVLLTLTECLVDTETIKSICEKQQLKYKNQSIGTLLMELLEKHFNCKRISFTKQEREQIVNSQNNFCNLCGDKIGKSFQIDHIRPLSNGGNNEKDNLQALCISCHQEKTKEEHNNCEHFNVKDYMSSYNIEAYDAINSKFFTKVQFTQYMMNESRIEKLKEKFNMYSIDMNKCRRNLLINYDYNFPVFSCLDNIQKFNGKITDGYYYIETNNVFPLRKNGFYSKPMVEFCLNEKIISMENIKYQYKSSLHIKSNYFKPFVNHLMEVFENKDIQKLSVNSLIGMFGRRDNSFVDNFLCLKDCIEDIASVYSTYQRPYINDINDEYCVITSKINIDKLESAYPIYAQILDCETIEL